MKERDAFAVLMGGSRSLKSGPQRLHFGPSSRSSAVDVEQVQRKSGGTQLHLDLGQRDFAVATCPTCGMMYGKGLPEEDRLHEQFHNAHAAVFRFQGWASERVILREAARWRLICVLPSDPPAHAKKVRDVCGRLERVLGVPEGYLMAPKPQYKVFLWVSSESAAGGAVAQGGGSRGGSSGGGSAGAGGGGGGGGRSRIAGVLVAQLQTRARWSLLTPRDVSPHRKCQQQQQLPQLQRRRQQPGQQQQQLLLLRHSAVAVPGGSGGQSSVAKEEDPGGAGVLELDPLSQPLTQSQPPSQPLLPPSEQSVPPPELRTAGNRVAAAEPAVGVTGGDWTSGAVGADQGAAASAATAVLRSSTTTAMAAAADGEVPERGGPWAAGKGSRQPGDPAGPQRCEPSEWLTMSLAAAAARPAAGPSAAAVTCASGHSRQRCSGTGEDMPLDKRPRLAGSRDHGGEGVRQVAEPGLEAADSGWREGEGEGEAEEQCTTASAAAAGGCWGSGGSPAGSSESGPATVRIRVTAAEGKELCGLTAFGPAASAAPVAAAECGEGGSGASGGGGGGGGGGRGGRSGSRSRSAGMEARVVLGVRGLWVEPGSRRRGAARRMLDVARCCMVPGVTVGRDQVAFSACAVAACAGEEDGGAAFTALAMSYAGGAGPSGSTPNGGQTRGGASGGGTNGSVPGSGWVLLYDDDEEVV